MTRRALPPKVSRLASQIERAQSLAAISDPLVAELYQMHLKACEERLQIKSQRVRTNPTNRLA